MRKTLCLVLMISVGITTNLYAFDDTITHPLLTDRAVRDVQIRLNTYFKDKLNLPQGVDTILSDGPKNEKTVRQWLMSGARTEDDPMCRASNHFHNPSNTLPWADSGLTDQFWFINKWCGQSDYPPETITSAVHWGTGYYGPAPDGEKETGGRNHDDWDHARERWYIYLTGKNAQADIIKSERIRNAYLAWSLEDLGQVLHLLQDMAVPSHVRNDFASHLEHVGITLSTLTHPTQWVSERFELYVKQHGEMIGSGAGGDLQNKTVTNFWDTNNYHGDNPAISMQPRQIGLAEYTNINFASKNTIFAEGFRINGDPSNDIRYHPYPRKSSTNVDEYISGVLKPETVIGEDHVPDTSFHISKKYDGEEITYFVKPTYLSKPLIIAEGSNVNVFYRSFMLDEDCFKEYATKLLPKAVGYSAALLDYFFRGNIEITLPDKGYYAQVDPEKPNEGFKQLKVLARNITQDEEKMENGSVELAVKYRMASSDPFQNPPDPPTEVYYATFKEADNCTIIPREAPVELRFDLSESPIPLWAVDVSIQVVYHGRLGAEEGAVAVGFRDISEPTPIQYFNNLDKICLFDKWYDAGSADAVRLVDDNQDGIADKHDVYAHDIKEFYFRMSPVGRLRYPTPSDRDYYLELFVAGTTTQALYVLTDYSFNVCTGDYWVVPIEPEAIDHWLPFLSPGFYFTIDAVKNRYEPASREECEAHSLTYPCIKWHNTRFIDFRAEKLPSFTIIDMPSYPANSYCPLDLLK